MGGFTSATDYRAASKANPLKFSFSKAMPSGARWHSSFRSAGMPAAGADPTLGLAGAETVSKASAGALPFPDAGASLEWWITRAVRASTVNLAGYNASAIHGWTLIVDRLAHAQVAINQATGAFSPVIDGTARLAAGEGAMIIAEVSSALSAGNNVFTLDYTDQDGNAATTPSVTTVASAGANSLAYSIYPFINLADGDTGARTITGWTLVSGTATGQINLALVKVLGAVPGTFAGEISDVDLLLQANDPVAVPNAACVNLLVYSGISGSQSGYLFDVTMLQK
jgi:hypothetical protein